MEAADEPLPTAGSPMMIAAYIFSLFRSHLQAPESFKDQPGIYRQQVELPAQEPLHNEPCGREGCKKPRRGTQPSAFRGYSLPPKVKVALPNRVKPQLTEMNKGNSRTRVTSDIVGFPPNISGYGGFLAWPVSFPWRQGARLLNW